MAEDTSILQEIDEALRADKAEQFWASHSGTIITCCLLVVLSSAASVWWKNHVHDQQQLQTSLIVRGTKLASEGKFADSIPPFEQAEAQGGKLATIAGLKHAEALLDMKQDDKALAVYNDIAAGKIGDATDLLRDFARLEATILSHNRAGGKAPAGNEPEAGGTFNASVSELAGIRALQSGDTKTAIATFSKIISDEATPPSMRERDTEFLSSIKDIKK
jgi:hypothetical protein